ncbi:hypothetical protein ABBQ32_011838 [Trebouxia sp. C0010 RCD-2024]
MKMQNIFHLAFAAGVCGSADVLLSSDDGGCVRVWSVCPSAEISCIWQSSASQACQLLVRNCFVQLQLHSTQAESCLAVTSGRLISFMPLYEAVKASGDPTMLFCISSSEARLITLRAYPECSDFCNAVDKSCGVATAVSVPNEAGVSQQARQRWSADPIISSWLPGPSRHEPAAASRPSSTSCTEPNSMHLCSTGLSPGRCMHQAPASGHAHRQHHDHVASSVCRKHTCQAPLASSHSPASSQPTALPSEGPVGPDAQASPANTVTTPLRGGNACAEAQHTYTRHRQNSSNAGRQAKRSRPADYAWLQGADDTPATTAQHVRPSLLWWNREAGQSDKAHVSSEGCNAVAAVSTMGSQSLEDTLVRYSCDASGDACFDAQKGRFQYPFQGHTQPINHLLPLRDGLHVLTSSDDGMHKLWTVEGIGVCTFKTSLKCAHGCVPALTLCERFLVAAHGKRTFAWQMDRVVAEAGRLPDGWNSNHCIVLTDHKCPMTALAVSTCNSMMASADASGRIVVRFSLQQTCN